MIVQPTYPNGRKRMLTNVVVNAKSSNSKTGPRCV